MLAAVLRSLCGVYSSTTHCSCLLHTSWALLFHRLLTPHLSLCPTQAIFDTFSFTNLSGLSEANREKMEQLRQQLAAGGDSDRASVGGAGAAGGVAAQLAAVDGQAALVLGPPPRLSINQLMQYHELVDKSNHGSGSNRG